MIPILDDVITTAIDIGRSLGVIRTGWVAVDNYNGSYTTMLSGTQTAFIGQLGLSTKQLHHIKILHTGLRCVRHSCQKIKYVNLCKG